MKPSLPLLIGLLFTTVSARADDSVLRTFELATETETGPQGCADAIGGYESVLARSAADPSLAAKARLRLATCYDRVGRLKDAIATLQAMPSGPETPADVARTAQTQLERLRAREEKESRVKVPVSTPTVVAAPAVRAPAVRLPWRFWVDGGPASTRGVLPQLKDTRAVWFGAGKTFREGLTVGLEGARFIRHHTTYESVSVDPHYYGTTYTGRVDADQSGLYAGLFIEGSANSRRWTGYLRGGAGAMLLKEDGTRTEIIETVNSIYSGTYRTESTRNDRVIKPAVPFAIGLDWNANRYLSLGFGVREIITATEDRVEKTYITGVSDTRTRLGFVTMPFVKVTLTL